jgi:hypothetical protein
MPLCAAWRLSAAARSWAITAWTFPRSPATRIGRRWSSKPAIGELTPYATAVGSFNDKLVMLDRHYPTFPSLAPSAKFAELRAMIEIDAFGRCRKVATERRADPVPCRNRVKDCAGAEPIEVTTARSDTACHAVALVERPPGSLSRTAEGCTLRKTKRLKELPNGRGGR